MQDLYQALYHSKALLPNTVDSHNDILRASQINNSRDNITGFLHREDGYFLQFLEGPKTKLFATLQRIGHDPRHCDFVIKHFGPAERRMLPDWDMGYAGTDQLSLRELLDTSGNKLEFRALDPFDLVVFIVHNAQALRTRLSR